MDRTYGEVVRELMTFHVAESIEQSRSLWHLRESIPLAQAEEGLNIKHDISVPVADMPRFMVEAATEVEARFAGSRVVAFGHLGDGNVHFNVQSPPGASADWLERDAPAVTTLVHDLVTEAGGSISAEHGIGQMKLAELTRLGGIARLQAMRAIKRALDPKGIMNPGKLVPAA